MSSAHPPLSAHPGHVARGSVILGLDVTSIYKTLNELTTVDVIVSCALLLLLAAVGIALIRSSMRPLSDIERTAEAIAAGDLGRRVPERDPRTEVGRLGRSLNIMLAHIEAAFRARMASEEAARRSEEAARRSALDASRSEDRMRQFVADASHELRTPLTAIRGFAEYYRQRGGVVDASQDAGDTPADTGDTSQDACNALRDAAAVSPPPATGAGPPANGPDTRPPAGLPAGPLTHADLDRLIERVESEAMRMGVLVDDMLLLARLDQERPLDFKTVDLLAIAADALHDARVIAPQRAIHLTVGTADAPLVTGDEVGLRQVVGNLMSNALTHTPEGTPIDITIRSGALHNGDSPNSGAAQTPTRGGGHHKARTAILLSSSRSPTKVPASPPSRSSTCSSGSTAPTGHGAGGQAVPGWALRSSLPWSAHIMAGSGCSRSRATGLRSDSRCPSRPRREPHRISTAA